jgi:hypothetical protein
MDELEKLGFIEVGFWKLDIKKTDRIDFEINEEHLQRKELLYCFISGSTPYYFGISDKTLKERMRNYKAGKEDGTAGSTNKKVHAKILQFLNVKMDVKIFVLEPKYKLVYENLKVNIGKGIEHSLIEKYDRDEIWNDRGSSSSKKITVKINSSIDPKRISANTFFLKRGVEFKKGWIILGKGAHDLLPDRSCEVFLTIGDIKLTSSCRFTYSGNNRKINGGKDMLGWIKKLKPNSNVFVEIIDSRNLRVYEE